jgi:hypothetical protein
VLVEILGIFAVSVAASTFLYWFRGHYARRLETHRRVKCGLRVVDGRFERLGSAWQWGTATISPRRLSFVANGFPLLKRAPVLIPVTAVHVARQRAMLPWGNSTNFVITPLGVPGARLDWAVPHDHLDRAIDELRSA